MTDIWIVDGELEKLSSPITEVSTSVQGVSLSSCLDEVSTAMPGSASIGSASQVEIYTDNRRSDLNDRYVDSSDDVLAAAAGYAESDEQSIERLNSVGVLPDESSSSSDPSWWAHMHVRLG